jgi:hypothetical protein
MLSRTRLQAGLRGLRRGWTVYEGLDRERRAGNREGSKPEHQHAPAGMSTDTSRRSPKFLGPVQPT